jgi:uncharacterized protein YndB with AHSA1/START domain
MTELNLTRVLRAGRERVWRAWTDGAELAAWFWPASFATEAQVDARVGGSWRVASEAAGMAASGQFVDVEPHSRLVYTWRWDGEEHETLVTLTLADAPDGGTVLTLTHERFESEQSAADHEQGWSDCLDRLPTFIVVP